MSHSNKESHGAQMRREEMERAGFTDWRECEISKLRAQLALPLADTPAGKAVLAEEGERCVQLGLEIGYQNAVHKVLAVIAEEWPIRRHEQIHAAGMHYVMEQIAASLGVTLGPDGKPNTKT